MNASMDVRSQPFNQAATTKFHFRSNDFFGYADTDTSPTQWFSTEWYTTMLVQRASHEIVSQNLAVRGCKHMSSFPGMTLP